MATFDQNADIPGEGTAGRRFQWCRLLASSRGGNALFMVKLSVRVRWGCAPWRWFDAIKVRPGRWKASPVTDPMLDDVTAAQRALGRQLAQLRAAADLNQHELAALVNYTRSSIANVETGRQRMGRAF